MTARRPDDAFAVELVIDAPRGRVFDALVTLEGLAHWWTPDVNGSPVAGGELTFGFGGAATVMRVDRVDPPGRVVWTCVSPGPWAEWAGTTVSFELRPGDGDTTMLEFRHRGLVPALECYAVCAAGWEHYLTSLVDTVQGAVGSPYGSTGWLRHRAARAG